MARRRHFLEGLGSLKRERRRLDKEEEGEGGRTYTVLALGRI